MNERDQRIIDVIRSLREGEVVTYGDIAEDAGYREAFATRRPHPGND